MSSIQFSVKDIHESLVYRKMYTINGKNDAITYSSDANIDDFFHTAERMIDLTQDPKYSIEERHKLIGCAYEYLKQIHKEVKSDDDKLKYNELLSKTFLLIVGKTLNKTNIESFAKEITANSDWYQFLINSHIHYAIHRQGISYLPKQDTDVAGWVNVKGEWIQWTDLEKKEEENGFSFYRKDELLFSTDKKLKLKGYFWAGEKGIVKGNPMQAEGLGDFFQRPASGKHWLSIYSIAKGDTDVRFGSSHCYMSLENSQGNLSYAGQYGVNRQLSPLDMLTPFGKKGVGIETPDRYSSMPVGQHLIKELRVEITAEQYRILKESIENDKRNTEQGSIIAGNCATYIQKKLELIGLKTKVSMTALEFFLRFAIHPLPRTFNKKIVQWVGNLPDIVRKAAYFCPFIYLPMLAITLGSRLLSGFDSDISIIDAFVRPWNVKVDHPLALFENMDELQKKANQFQIYNTSVKDQSEIGTTIQQMYDNLGFDKDEKARLKVKTPKHATQYNPKSFVAMVLKGLEMGIKYKIESFMSRQTVIDQNTMVLYLNGLKTQKLITPYEFHSLKRAIDDKPMLIQELQSIGQKLYQKKSIDRRSHIHFNDLLSQGNTNEALCYLFSIQLSIQLNTDHYKNTLKELVDIEMQGDIQTALEYYHHHFIFKPDDIIKIQSLVSKVKCYEWAETVQDPETKEELKKAIKSTNEQDFIDIAQRYFESLGKKKSASATEKKILEEMSQSIQNHQGHNAFVGFAHVMQTQQMILDMEKDLEKLCKIIEKNADGITKGQVDELKTMHQNMGIFLSNEAVFMGSHTWLSSHLGRVREIWQHMDDLVVSKKNGNKIIPAITEKDTWPDIGFREIKPVSLNSSTSQQPLTDVTKKKVFISYCTWGNGHKATAEAYARYLSDTYRVSTCDLPDEVLIEKDPLFNLLGKHNSITTLYNTLVSRNYWSVLGLLRKMGSAPSPEMEMEIQKDMIRRKILQEKPDVIVATYERHTKHLMELAEELGIPFLQVSTDMVSKFENIDQTKHAYEHFKLAIPFGLKEATDPISEKIKKDQIVVTGYPIRPEFLTKMDKAEIQKEYKIDPQEKVILCMNGGCGGNVPWPKMMANAEKGAFGKCKMYVVCGKNEVFFNEVKSYKPKDPDIEIIPLGWTDGKTLAKLNTIADVVVTKPGGASTAETLQKSAFMLLDTRFSKDLPWELDTANLIEKYEQGISLTNENDYCKLLKKALTKSQEKRADLPGALSNPLQVTQDLIADMIKKAESDKALVQKRHEPFDSKRVYGEMPIEKCNNETFNQNLSEIIKFTDNLFPKAIVPSLYRSLWKASREKCFIQYNSKEQKFETSPVFDKDQMVYAMLVLKRLSKEKNGLPLEPFKHITKLVIRQQKQSKKEDMDLLLNGLSDLDRGRVAKMLKDGKLALPKNESEAKDLYFLPKAKKQLNEWLQFKTSRGRIKKNDESVFKNREDALQAFICHPEEYDFVQKLYLHRKLSAFNHQFDITDGHIFVMLDGKMTPVSELMKAFNYVNDRIINLKDQREFIYTYDKGLCAIDNSNDPYDWKDTIPVFKHKQRKSQDYRMEVLTTIGKKQNHGWIRLKDPTGNVYSLGRLWDRDYQLEEFKRLKTIPGYIRAGDIQEYIGEEENWKRTKFVLSQTDFAKLKNKAIEIQKKEKSYNLINQNCLSFVEDMFKEIGIDHKVGTSTLNLLLTPAFLRKFLIRHKTIDKICRVAVYPFILLKNAFFSVLGIFERRDTRRYEQGGFTEALDFFKTEKSLIDHHTSLRLIQEIMEEDFGDAKKGLKIFWSDYREKLKGT